MKVMFAVIGVAALAGAAWAQEDYRVDADFRVPSTGRWASGESVGGASFRVHSRYLAVYYGGVLRQDNFSFSVQVDFRDISGFAENFGTSPYNTDLDVYINDDFVGRVSMSQSAFGLAELTYQSRHPSFPELPVPANWPSPISPGSQVRVFAAAATLPNIGDPFPSGQSLLALSTLEERFARGDADHDGHVDETDFAILAMNYDPQNLVGPHVGPMAGDFTGDNRSDLSDFEIMVLNWDDRHPPENPPVPCMEQPRGPRR